ncbi:site-specific DNA-methyltransferase [Gemmata sp. G18]|uniref:Methyltransferase n=1 Tax=Gemmata palustris TaxID=2822762 RepID=A0ABS5BZ84_9BACT|nr:site-specific DNA-methyltransferase [Gemmata palustris]MBP3959003.1 site-specific DNA-methyltransferase [Gemmata palustris]
MRTQTTPPTAEQNGQSYRTYFEEFRAGTGYDPLFLCGDALKVLTDLPADSIDCVMTSPPYWGQRDYGGGGIGLEATWQEYVANLSAICEQLKRVLKPTGSFWLNIGDAYQNKNLLGLPWRVALTLTDQQGWVLRNDVVWNKVKGGMDNATDKLRNNHEFVFHFVKKAKGYFYNVGAARHQPRQSKVVGERVVSATGVSGVRYRRQIELTTAMNDEEKKNALAALEGILTHVRDGNLSDFRMIIRGVQRATHSDSEKVSGRARELKEKGFYFLKYHPNGAKLSDVWEIMPEDTQKRKAHFAPYPEDLCKLPILTTCPEGGIVLDPFAGTGTTNYVAFRSGMKSVGIEISPEHIKHARERCRLLL